MRKTSRGTRRRRLGIAGKATVVLGAIGAAGAIAAATRRARRQGLSATGATAEPTAGPAVDEKPAKQDQESAATG